MPTDSDKSFCNWLTGMRIAPLNTPSMLLTEIRAMLSRCDPVNFSGLSQASKNVIAHHYGNLVPDPYGAKNDLVPEHQNETALPEIVDIPECSGKKRSFPFKLDNNDKDRKTIAETAFDDGSYNLTNGREIRAFVSSQKMIILKELPGAEKMRLIRHLLDGWIYKGDIDAIELIYMNATLSERLEIKSNIDLSKLRVPDQRKRLAFILDHS